MKFPKGKKKDTFPNFYAILTASNLRMNICMKKLMCFV